MPYQSVENAIIVKCPKSDKNLTMAQTGPEPMKYQAGINWRQIFIIADKIENTQSFCQVQCKLSDCIENKVSHFVRYLSTNVRFIFEK